MRKASKILVTTLCVLAVVCMSVMGTLAYLTSRASVSNTFTVGNVEIKVDEADVNEMGKPIAGADRVLENKYHLIPGQSYTKDPTMTVLKDSEESYVRMLVKINCYSALTAINPDFLPETYVDGWDRDVWECVGIEVNGDEATYEFRYFKTVDAKEAGAEVELPALFTSFEVPGEMTGEQLATIQELVINVEGHAIQVLGFDDADKAWEAFDKQMGNP